MLLTAVKLAPALAMGNTVVIKSSELAPATMFEFAKLIEKNWNTKRSCKCCNWIW